MIAYRPGTVRDSPAMEAVEMAARDTDRGRDWAAWIENRPPFARPGTAKRAELALEDDALVGFAACRHGSHEPGIQADMTGLFVLPSHHGRGIGAALVGRIARWLLDDGLDSLSVDVVAANPAVAFYRRLGGRVLHHWDDGEPCLTLGFGPLAPLAERRGAPGAAPPGPDAPEN